MDGQLPPAIPSHTYISDHDPNTQKNRIPTESERSGLRILADTLKRSINGIMDDMKRAQNDHDALLAKYQRQFRELEGTQSQLHESKRVLTLTKGQCTAYRAESDRIAGILHPIHSCPSDVIRHIFEWTCSMSSRPLEVSIRLSHVSQRWRSIALDSPQLWSQLTIGAWREPSILSQMFECLIPRIKMAPCTIDIVRVNPERWRALTRHDPYPEVPVTAELTIGLKGVINLRHITSLPRFLSPIGVQRLAIEDDQPDSSLEGDEIAPWDLGLFLKACPPISSFYLSACCALRISPSNRLEALTTISLEGVINVDIASILENCTQLITVELDRISFGPTAANQIHSTSLQTLILVCYDGDDAWLTRTSCPNLATFLHRGCPFPENCMSFLETHQSVVSLEFVGDHEIVVRVAAIAGQLRSLTIDPFLSHLYEWPVTKTGANAFPALHELTVCTLDSPITVNDFEGIVKARCLPSSHPQSTLVPKLRPLDTLSIRMSSAIHLDEIAEPWCNSHLYKSAEKRVTPDPIWNRWQILNLSWI